ncbi:MAG: M23 family metallopeptidase [Acidimicrobiales bacterium]|nr:M23 family metallopeptidase [Acidimicrobiales bacterium]
MSRIFYALSIISLFALLPIGHSSAQENQPALVEVGESDSPFLLERKLTLPFFTSKASEVVSIIENRIETTTTALTDLATAFASIRSRQEMVEKSLENVAGLLLERIEGAEKIMVDRAEKLENIEEVDKVRLQEDKRKYENIERVMELANSKDWVCPVANTVKFYDTWNEKRPRGIHRGVDLVGFHGADLYAPVDGEVTFFWDSVGGKSFRLIAENGDYYFGTHLYRYGKKSGKVSAGDVIGQLGAGGNATGPHLHFEFHAGPMGRGNELNPYQIVNQRCTNRIPIEMPLNHTEEEEREKYIFSYGNFEWD